MGPDKREKYRRRRKQLQAEQSRICYTDVGRNGPQPQDWWPSFFAMLTKSLCAELRHPTVQACTGYDQYSMVRFFFFLVMKKAVFEIGPVVKTRALRLSMRNQVKVRCGKYLKFIFLS